MSVSYKSNPHVREYGCSRLWLSSGTPTTEEKRKKKIHKEPVFPKRNVLEGTITSAQKKKKKSLFEIFCFVVLYTVHTLKNVIKLEATGRQKVLDNESKRPDGLDLTGTR